MDLKKIYTLKKEELEILKRKLSFSDIQKRVRDLPPRDAFPSEIFVETIYNQADNKDKIIQIIAENNACEFNKDLNLSPFSIESLIWEELFQKKEIDFLNTPEIPFIISCKRRMVPLDDPKVESKIIHNAKNIYKKHLSYNSKLYMIWTERFFYGGFNEDLQEVSYYLEKTNMDKEKQDRSYTIRADYPIDPYSIYESYMLGATSLTVFLEILSNGQIEDIIGHAKECSIVPIAVANTNNAIDKVNRHNFDYTILGYENCFENNMLTPHTFYNMKKDMQKKTRCFVWYNEKLNKSTIRDFIFAGISSVIIDRDFDKIINYAIME